MIESLTVVTKSRLAAIEITSEVEKLVRKSGVSDGLCQLYVPHTTAGIFINERDDPAVAQDIMDTLDRLVPRAGSYRHAEGNSDSHIKSLLTGNTAAIPVAGGWMNMGRWQGIFFAEFDGPRTRSVLVTITAS